MSIFASRTHETIAIPHDPPNTVTIRKLTGRGIDLAQSEYLKGLINGRTSRGWMAHFQRQLKEGTATDEDASNVLNDPLNGYDAYSVIGAGVIGWSYEDGGHPKPVTPEAIADLDEESVTLFATEIMRRTKPALFLTVEAAEDARKND